MISRITPRDVIGRDAAFGQCGDDVVVGHRVAHQASEVGHAFALAEEIREKNDHCAGRFLRFSWHHRFVFLIAFVIR